MNTLTLPEVRPADTAGDDMSHVFCCDPDRALCGEDITGELVAEDAPDEDKCVVCEDLWESDVPCGALFCRLRQRLRGDR